MERRLRGWTGLLRTVLLCGLWALVPACTLNKPGTQVDAGTGSTCVEPNPGVVLRSDAGTESDGGTGRLCDSCACVEPDFTVLRRVHSQTPHDFVFLPDGALFAVATEYNPDPVPPGGWPTTPVPYMIIVGLRPDGSPSISSCGITFGRSSGTHIAPLADGTFIIAGHADQTMSLRTTTAPDAPLQNLVSYQNDTSISSVIGLAITAEGSILVGFNASSSSPSGRPVLMLHRYLPDGSLDTTFGTGGMAQYTGEGMGRGSALTRLPDGRLVVVMRNGPSLGESFVMRLLPDGQLDPTFSGGIVRTECGETALVPLEDGRLLVGCKFRDASWAGLRFLRLQSDGTLDPTFGCDGQLTVPIPEIKSMRGLWIRPEGKLLVLTDDVLLQFRPDGTLDPAFGEAGQMLLRLHPTVGKFAPDGSLVVLGQVFESDIYQASQFARQRIWLP
jgi:uncharacterized delta-60 repeat protein